MTKRKQMTKNNQKKTHLKPSDPVPEDIHWEWLELIKALQAACSGNNGYAKLTVNVSVHKNKPVLWVTEFESADKVVPPSFKLLRLSPKRLADAELTYETALALVSQSN